MLHYIPFKNRSLFTVAGEDAAHFLQGIITNDIHKVTETDAVYACMLTPQGKYLCDMFIILWQGRFFLDVGTKTPEAFLRKLTFYKLRAKVEIKDVSGDYEAFAVTEKMALVDDAVCYPDPRAEKLGFRAIIKRSTMPALPMGKEEAYETLRLSLGIPDGLRDLVAEDSFPLAFDMEALHAVDFKKGCYVGQEVTARSKHRGLVKKGLFRVTAKTALPGYGTPIMAGASKLGELLSSQGTIGLALIRWEEREKAAGLPVTVADVELVSLDEAVSLRNTNPGK